MQQYQYTADLLSLDFCRPESTVDSEKLSVVSTPLQLSIWEDSLRFHPDRAFARYILRGIREGFRVGFDRRSPLKSAARNLQSAQEHPEVIQQYLEKECSLGCMLGPFTKEELSSLPLCHVNRFGVNTGKLRLIPTSPSHPRGV